MPHLRYVPSSCFPCAVILTSALVATGIYLAKDAAIAETFATFASSVCQWPNSACIIEKCMTLAEVVNQPTRFVYNYLVHGRSQRNTAKQSKNTLCVGDTGWVIWCVASSFTPAVDSSLWGFAVFLAAGISS